VIPTHYTLSLNIDPAVSDGKYTGTVAISLQILEPNVKSITLHADPGLGFTTDSVSLLHPAPDASPVKPVNITRWTSSAPWSDNSTVTFFFADDIVQQGFHGNDVDGGDRGRSTLPPTLIISFAGRMGEKSLRGFYRYPVPKKASNSTSSHTSKNEWDYVAVTHFEPVSARTAFPCFDEPALKATLDMIVAAPQEYLVVSNMPAILDDEDENNGGGNQPGGNAVSGSLIKKASAPPGNGIPPNWKRWQFEKSKPMSSYLFVWGLGKFKILEGKTQPFTATMGNSNKMPPDLRANNGTIVRILVRDEDEKELGKFALEVSLRSIEFFERQWGVGFPVPKMDMFPMPGFAGTYCRVELYHCMFTNWRIICIAEGMENWGMVVLDADALLVDPTSDPEDLIYSSNLIAHEIAHHVSRNVYTKCIWLICFVLTYFVYSISVILRLWNGGQTFG
jgi:aminopeptidase N